jgi:Tyrosine phosphatase family
MDRHLAWDGCWNAWDLGGLRATSGSVTRPGSVIRSESLHLVSPAGWRAIEAYGVRTLVDLRNPDQCDREPQTPPPSITTVNVPLEDGLDDDPESSPSCRAHLPRSRSPAHSSEPASIPQTWVPSTSGSSPQTSPPELGHRPAPAAAGRTSRSTVRRSTGRPASHE